MNMRAFFTCFLLCVVIFGGCKKQADPFIGLNVETFVFESGDSSQTASIENNGDWNVSSDAAWCTVSPENGSGSGAVTVTVAANESTEERKSVLTFTCGAETARVEVTQAGAEPDEEEFPDDIQTLYTDVDWTRHEIASCNTVSGDISIRIEGDAPVLKINRTIVLPEEYGYEIRVIKSATANGNTATLQTERGNMGHLFMDTSFTLTTDPNAARFALKSAGGGRVFTLTEIRAATEPSTAKAP